jgi:homoserine O-succinyltransferase
MSASPPLANYASRAPVQTRRTPVVIALVNNMPDPALQTTERQFRELLGAGAEFDVQLRLFSFPELIRGQAGRACVAEHYEPIERLWLGGFDGLIVTGAEPRTSALSDEVYWQSMTRLLDWADDAAMSTVWSCLAAHAAVLHLDGIQRRRLSEKLSGVFACRRLGDDPLLAGLPQSWGIPHSRYNTLDTSRLVESGYEILSASDEAGADTFTRRGPGGGLFVFYQGHPEYDAGALFREYRRDVGRFLDGTTDQYPEMPRGYFDEAATEVFEVFRARAQRDRSRELLEGFPRIDGRGKPAHVWRDPAARLYSNWLTTLVADRRRAVPSDDYLTLQGPFHG